MESSIEERTQSVCHDGGDGNTDETWHHEGVVEQVLTNDGGARAVEVHGGNIRWVVRNEEVSINTWQNAQEHRTSNA